MIDYSQVIKAWREYQKNINFVKKTRPELEKHCLDFISWCKKNVGEKKRKIQ